MLLNKLVSKGVQQAISILEGTKAQGADAYKIGTTVQPIVNVNVGYKKVLTGSFAGNATSSVTVPTGKCWLISKGVVKLVTDATVVNLISNFGVVLYGYST